MPDSHVHVVRVFGHRPAGHFLDGSRGAVSGEHRLRVEIASVVEVDYFLEIEQIAVMHVGLHETGVRHLTYVANCGGLELTFEERQKLSPSQVGRSAVLAIEEKADTFIGEAWPERIPCEAPLIRGVFRIPRENDIPRKAEVV